MANSPAFYKSAAERGFNSPTIFNGWASGMLNSTAFLKPMILEEEGGGGEEEEEEQQEEEDEGRRKRRRTTSEVHRVSGPATFHLELSVGRGLGGTQSFRPNRAHGNTT